MTRKKKPAPVANTPEPGAERRCLATVELVILERGLPEYRSDITRHRPQCTRFDRGHPADKRDCTAFHRNTPDATIGPVLWLDRDERVVLVRERPVGGRPFVRAATKDEVLVYEARISKAKEVA